jgi:hypothetical protein
MEASWANWIWIFTCVDWIWSFGCVRSDGGTSGWRIPHGGAVFPCDASARLLKPGSRDHGVTRTHGSSRRCGDVGRSQQRQEGLRFGGGQDCWRSIHVNPTFTRWRGRHAEDGRMEAIHEGQRPFSDSIDRSPLDGLNGKVGRRRSRRRNIFGQR